MAIEEKLKKISLEMKKEKSTDVKHTKKITKICAGIVISVVVVCLIATLANGFSESIEITKRANRLLQESINEDVFEEIAEFDRYYNRKSIFAKMFFTKAAEIDDFKAQVNALVETSADEIENKISQLKPITEIKSEDEYNEILKTYNSIQLSSNDEFESSVKDRVSNYSEFETLYSDFQALVQTYESKCGMCGGDGKLVCRLCRGSGSRMVNYTTPNGKTWRVSQECKKNETCRTCGGDGKTYTFE